MGGRGAKSGMKVVHRIMDNWESMISADNPLIYGNNDPNLTKEQRTVLEKFEDMHWNDDIEHALLIDYDGNTMDERTGDGDSVSYNAQTYLASYALTHNHPREDGIIGGTFSVEDLDNLCIAIKQKTIRATAKEGTYSISKLSEFDEVEFRKYYKSQFKKTEKARSKKSTEIQTEFSHKVDALFKQYGGTDTYTKLADEALKEYRAELAKNNNNMLISNHNALINGQTKYGYYYTLERRPG